MTGAGTTEREPGMCLQRSLLCWRCLWMSTATVLMMTAATDNAQTCLWYHCVDQPVCMAVIRTTCIASRNHAPAYCGCSTLT